jgi:hypothetical protein
MLEKCRKKSQNLKFKGISKILKERERKCSDMKKKTHRGD